LEEGWGGIAIDHESAYRRKQENGVLIGRFQ
jgi:hypothetical protein